MSHTPHELADDFPEFATEIHDLKTSDPHFRNLFDEYHDVNRAVHRAETRVEALSDEAEATLRRRRMQLKDELVRLIEAKKATQ
ncbi:MAG: YdcH family protein [Pikeienuella sp.]